MTVLHSLLQSISLAMNQGLMTQKKKKRKTVSIMTRGLPGSESQKKQQRADDKEEEAAQDGVEKSRRLQQDPLRGKIRDAMPEEYLLRASKWYCCSIILRLLLFCQSLRLFCPLLSSGLYIPTLQMHRQHLRDIVECHFF